ncbi:hypothetical protein [Fuscovulum blasticum]|uniref:hypothetical protein n=1 Tax=Fuscovulum blasticum TaxID=1075 RepID=UPI000D3EB834|nr:hypothetical protein [Fuscovulum blasticum]AWD23383.1 hypothetical protein B6K69_07905 [Fuscovulum blasticum]
MTNTLTARIEVFRPGTFTPMQGEPITYSAADLKAVADAYDPETAPAPVVVGHPDTDAPAYGWVKSFDYDTKAERLFANVHQIEPQFADLVKAGRYKKVSMAFFGPAQGHNPVPGCWYPKHVGFLGAAAPAVSGLKNITFAGDAGATFTAAYGAGSQSASLFRRLRDWLIESDGIEAADKILPTWEIDWLDDADEPQELRFSAAPTDPQPQPKKEPAVPNQPDAAFAAREADVATREQRLAAREAEIAHAENVTFAEGLVQDGRLIPASKDKVVAILDALPATATVAFSEAGEKLAPAAAIREVLQAQPKVVTFGEQDLGGDPEGTPATFAADGRPVDAAALAIHNKALAYQRAHPGTEFMDAVRAVS